MKIAAELGLVAAALGFDVRTDKIPNRLCLLGAVAGLLLRSLEGGSGIAAGLWGLLLAFGLLCLPFMLQIIGAGDVKLFMALGVFEGGRVLDIIWRTLLVAGCYGALLLGTRLLQNREDILGALSRRTKLHLTIPAAVGFVLYLVGV